MPVTRFADAAAVAFFCGGYPVTVANMLIEAGEAVFQLGQSQVEDHVVQRQLHRFRHSGKGIGTIKAGQFLAEVVDMLAGEAVDLLVRQLQTGVVTKTGGAVVLAVVEC